MRPRSPDLPISPADAMHDHSITLGELALLLAVCGGPVWLPAAAAQVLYLRRAGAGRIRTAVALAGALAGAAVLTPVFASLLPLWILRLLPESLPLSAIVLAALLASAVAAPLAAAAVLRGRGPGAAGSESAPRGARALP